MLSKDILGQIESGTIKSRTQLYKVVGRSKKLRLWLDQQGLLMPSSWNKQRVVQSLRDKFDTTGRIPRAADDWGFVRTAQNHFGSWNNAIFAAFGTYNQRRYDQFSKQELIDFINNFILETGYYPLREEFDGRRFPYWEVYMSRFNKKRWSEILGMPGIKEARWTRHGWGRRTQYDGNTYLSQQELLIGKWLTKNKILFEKEVPYSKYLNYMFDFYLPELGCYIEYYGLGTDDYKARMVEKRKHYAGRHVIEIFKHDNTLAKLSLEVQRLQSPPETGKV